MLKRTVSTHLLLKFVPMNRCPCGYYGDPIEPCSCAPSTVTKYQKRISGPVLDRIDIQVEVPRIDYQKLRDNRLAAPQGCFAKALQYRTMIL